MLPAVEWLGLEVREDPGHDGVDARFWVVVVDREFGRRKRQSTAEDKDLRLPAYVNYILSM